MKTTPEPVNGSIKRRPAGSDEIISFKQLYLLPAHLRKGLILVIAKLIDVLW
ncbi:hypothetical protein [Legionella norrlandica]|uniref:hypothetical protein n=1 Tax=Legionella norrlandica TaxID=1498499 RepID=UPI000B1DF229|nr:hypothetical protein [Legionella norrlandica]